MLGNNAPQGLLLQVAQLGHPVLRERALEVKNVKDIKTQELIVNLITTVMDVDGVGIAAPQVYQTVRIFILASHPNPRYPKAPEMEPTAIINPQILFYSDEIVKDWEGCLSIPGIRSKVPRHKVIEVEYTDRKGKKIKKKFTDFVARIFQHEYDHLEGIIFLDRLVDMKETVTEKEYQKMMAEEKKRKEKKKQGGTKPKKVLKRKAPKKIKKSKKVA